MKARPQHRLFRALVLMGTGLTGAATAVACNGDTTEGPGGGARGDADADGMSLADAPVDVFYVSIHADTGPPEDASDAPVDVFYVSIHADTGPPEDASDAPVDVFYVSIHADTEPPEDASDAPLDVFYASIHADTGPGVIDAAPDGPADVP
jgi:hypothetical protein